MGGLQFTQDDAGNWGYKVGGADTVHPFSSKPKLVANYDNTAHAQASSKEYDITSIVPDYKNKSVDDFFVKNVSYYFQATASKYLSWPLKMSYNNSTGIVRLETLCTWGTGIPWVGYEKFDLYIC